MTYPDFHGCLRLPRTPSMLEEIREDNVFSLVIGSRTLLTNVWTVYCFSEQSKEQSPSLIACCTRLRSACKSHTYDSQQPGRLPHIISSHTSLDNSTISRGTWRRLHKIPSNFAVSAVIPTSAMRLAVNETGSIEWYGKARAARKHEREDEDQTVL